MGCLLLFDISLICTLTVKAGGINLQDRNDETERQVISDSL